MISFIAQSAPDIPFSELGFAGAIIYILIDKGISYLKSRDKSSSVELEAKLALLDRISRKVDALFDWHNVKDSEGRFLWYTGRAFAAEVEKLKELVSDLLEVHRDTAKGIHDQAEAHLTLERMLMDLRAEIGNLGDEVKKRRRSS